MNSTREFRRNRRRFLRKVKIMRMLFQLREDFILVFPEKKKDKSLSSLPVIQDFDW